MLKTFFAAVRKQIADRRRYRLAIAEIESLSQRDLADLRADQTEMAHQAWNEIYGAGKA